MKETLFSHSTEKLMKLSISNKV